MKIKYIPAFRAYIALLQDLDPRLTARDFNNLYRTFSNTHCKDQT